MPIELTSKSRADINQPPLISMYGHLVCIIWGVMGMRCALFGVSYFAGGLGEAVCGALSEEPNTRVRRLAVTGIPRSGPGSVLMDMYGISARHIIAAVKDLVA